MSTEILLRYIHFICILTIAGTLVAENIVIKKTISRSEINKLARIDSVYGLAALALVAAGLTLWLGSYGKPAEFYSHNPIFHAKLGLFAAVGIASIYPTVFFLKQRKGDPADTIAVPVLIIRLLRLELILLAIIPLLAGLMAKGIGYHL